MQGLEQHQSLNPVQILENYGVSLEESSEEKTDILVPASSWYEAQRGVQEYFHSQDIDLESKSNEEGKDMAVLYESNFEFSRNGVPETGRFILQKRIFTKLDATTGLINKRSQFDLLLFDAEKNPITRLRYHNPYDEQGSTDSFEVIDRIVHKEFRGNGLLNQMMEQVSDPLLQSIAQKKQKNQNVSLNTPDPFVLHMGLKAGMTPLSEEDDQRLMEFQSGDDKYKIISSQNPLHVREGKRQNIIVPRDFSIEDLSDENIIYDTEIIPSSVRIGKTFEARGLYDDTVVEESAKETRGEIQTILE